MRLEPSYEAFEQAWTQGRNQVVYARLAADLDTPVSLMLKLAEARGLKRAIARLFAGEPVNTSEGRPALHTALRSSATTLSVAGEDVMPAIRSSRAQMRGFCDAVRSGRLRGYSGEPIRAIAYTVKGPQSEEDNFFAALSKIGFEVTMRPLQVFLGGAKNGDWDVGICMDAIRMAGKLDVVVLVSGDGDFEPLVSYLKYSEGCVVEVMAFGKTTSSKLREEADAFTDLGESKKFLLRK